MALHWKPPNTTPTEKTPWVWLWVAFYSKATQSHPQRKLTPNSPDSYGPFELRHGPTWPYMAHSNFVLAQLSLFFACLECHRDIFEESAHLKKPVTNRQTKGRTDGHSLTQLRATIFKPVIWHDGCPNQLCVFLNIIITYGVRLSAFRTITAGVLSFKKRSTVVQ